MKEHQSQIYAFDEFRLDASKRLLTKGNNAALPLTPKVFDTLLYLVRNGGKVIGKDELMSEIWTDSIVEENNLNQNISILRRLFGEKPGQHRFIVTIAGHGYRFVPEVKIVEENGAAALKPADIDQAAVGSKENCPEAATPSGSQKANWLYISFGILVFGLAASGYYFWKNSRVQAFDSKIRTLAVLPFKPVVAGNRDEALEMGITDTLISKLSGSGEITIRPLSSVRRYIELEQDPLTAGRELETEAVLDGTIQTSGDRIRISARLFRVNDGKQLWTGQFDEKVTDLFAVQDSISEKVAAALRTRLGGKDKKRYTENVEAFQLYMKGRFYLLKGGNPETDKSLTYFQQAIEADPNYALAYVGLADVYRGRVVGGGMSPAEFMPKAKAAAQKAVEIDDTLAEAHSALGHIIFWYDWDWEAAEKEHKRALELDPHSSDSLQFYAHLLSCTGRHAEALAEIKRAREIDPLNLRINAVEGLFLLHAGQTDEAIARLLKTLEMDPNYRLANAFAARAYIEKGMFAEAQAAIRKAGDVAPDSSEITSFGAYGLAKAGKLTEARAELDGLITRSRTRYVSPYSIALVYNGLGESEKALDYLEKAFAERDVKMVFLKVEPKWNNLRSESRFIELMRRMKFQ